MREKARLIRFAYFVAEGRSSAASYHQAYIYAKLIREHGLEFHFYPAPDWAWKLWRRYSKRPGMGARLVRGVVNLVIIPLWRLAQFAIALARGVDGLIMGPFLVTPASNPWPEVLLGHLGRRLHKPVVLYLSDAMQIPYPEQYAKRFQAASHVLCVTPWLRDEVGREDYQTFLSRVAIDITRYPLLARDDKEQIVLGFSGGSDNFPALLELESVIANMLQRYPQVHFVVVSNTSPAFVDPSLRFTLRKWLRDDPEGSLYESGVEEMLDFDIGLAPLLCTDYARGKDSAKLRQYMALGLPVVATNFGVNAEVIEDGTNGFLASNSEEWRQKLELLIQDKACRTRVGLAARHRVEGEFDARIQVAGLAAALRRCLAGS